MAAMPTETPSDTAQTHEDPWAHAIPAHFRSGMVVQGCVKAVTADGVLVEMEHGVEGVIALGDLGTDAAGGPLRTADVLKVGQPLDVRIVDVDPARRAIRISLKQADRDECIPAIHH